MKLFVGIILISIVSWGKLSEPEHTIIANTMHKYEGNLECEISVIVSPDNSIVQIARLDTFKGKFTPADFAKNSSKYKSTGIIIDLDKEFDLRGGEIYLVTAVFNITKDKKELELKIGARDYTTQVGLTKKKSISLEETFFKDQPKHCLK